MYVCSEEVHVGCHKSLSSNSEAVQVLVWLCDLAQYLVLADHMYLLASTGQGRNEPLCMVV